MRAPSTVRGWAPVLLIGTPNARTVEADNRVVPALRQQPGTVASPSLEGASNGE